MRKLVYEVLEKDEGKKVHNIVLGELKVSRHLYALLKKEEHVLVNGEKAHAQTIVHEKDSVEVHILEQEVHENMRPPFILYEDQDILIIDKPAPLSCMSRKVQNNHIENNPITLEDIIKNYLSCYHPVNRLDKGTSGVMLIAKNAHVHHLFQKQLKADDMVKTYFAIVEGQMPLQSGIMMYKIKDPTEGFKRFVSKEGKEAVTYFNPLYHTACGNTAVGIILQTGRTHQIRVHFSHIHHPVVGDFLYGTEHPSLYRRFALHSQSLEFYHPIKKEVIKIEAPVPQSFLEL